jgi:uracil-DNA glycosylase family 4
MSRYEEILKAMARVTQQQQELGLGDMSVEPEALKYFKNGNQPATEVDKGELLHAFFEQIKDCTKCRLFEGRNKFVFGVGNPDADLMFIGEGPGRDEDLQGEPFVGRAGQLLDKILAAIGFDRHQVYIANIVKCRPPNNRDPQPDEMAMCLPYLLQQIQIIDPLFICCLGRIAAQTLLDTTTPLGKLRGRFHGFQGRKLLVTYHPAALLRFQQYKRDTWEDVQMLRREYDAVFAR